ncbi:hypothetical protein AVO45_15410 [Ruegeria marisrubri]|uniref:NnrT protein n=1 Tax=Ruegeria marisrubri TaxID=1685379 RepID=A0A0X3TCG2_9RHOB|nr:hypothetical protein [Ruegeria marisrubri]KUJ73465.1 hypothetical protein AVO45_15410 [Ruegeria marisrubri]
MSGTRSPSRKEPATEGRWPVWKLAVLFYPFVAGAVAINLFLAGLIAHAVGYSAITPVDAVIWSIPLGIPATWAAGRWVRGLMDEADG